MTRHTWSLDGASEELAVDFETALFLSDTSSSIVLSMAGLLPKMNQQAYECQLYIKLILLLPVYLDMVLGRYQHIPVSSYSYIPA